MNGLTGQLAAVLASTDAVPRLVRQSASLFLVTPQGAVWRVFDSDEPTGTTRVTPGSDPRACVRLFMGSGPEPEIRVYRFGDKESRSANADRLCEQVGVAAT